MAKTKLWHAFLVAGGILAVCAPDIASLASTLSAFEAPWLKWPIRVLGILALIGSRWDKIRAKLKAAGASIEATPVKVSDLRGDLSESDMARLEKFLVE